MTKNLSLFNYHSNFFLLMNIFFPEWNLKKKNGPSTNSRRFPPKLRIKIHTPGNHYVHPPTCKIMINGNISLISIWQGIWKKNIYTILVMPRRTDQQQHLRSNIQYFLRSNIHTKKAYRMLHLISCAAHSYRVTWRSKAWMSILKIY